MKQLKTLSGIFSKAAQSIGLLAKNDGAKSDLPPTPARDPKMRTQKQRSQRAFAAMQKMEIQREFELQQKINESQSTAPVAGAPVAMETVRDFKPVRTVRFKKPKSDA